jgi:hypothetical protein
VTANKLATVAKAEKRMSRSSRVYGDGGTLMVSSAWLHEIHFPHRGAKAFMTRHREGCFPSQKLFHLNLALFALTLAVVAMLSPLG